MFLLLEIFCLILLLQSIGFIVSVYLERNSLADVLWGGVIAAGALYLILPLATMALANHPLLLLTPSLVMGALIMVWGIRLSFHIGLRFAHKTSEDPRYKAMSQGWNNYYLRSYLQVFLLQGVLMVAMLSALVVALLYPPDLNWWLGVGVAVWLFGFIFEIVGDAQLARFVKTKKPGQIMTAGLWRYTRHPNYFGEVTLWWGIWLISLPTPYWYLTLITPLTITFLILKVSGVPMAEARYKDNPEFQKYAERTNAFFPWWPKKA